MSARFRIVLGKIIAIAIGLMGVELVVRIFSMSLAIATFGRVMR
jgi:ABC-type transport system involved in multi-copper enzyme maturation permease subunit